MYFFITFTMIIAVVHSAPTKIPCTEITKEQDNEVRPTFCIISQVSDLNFAKTYELGERWIRTLKFINSNLSDIPTDLFTKFFSLRTLDLRHCGLENISRTSFTKGNQLYNLDLSYGSFSELKPQVFTFLTELKSLNVSHSQVQDIHVTAFIGLSKLLELNLSFNHLKRINNEILEPLSGLEMLDLSHNHIEVLDSELFIYNPKLKLLNCENNKLILVESGFLNPDTLLENLVLSHNYLQALELSNIKSRYIELNFNNLTVLEIGNDTIRISAIKNSVEVVSCLLGTKLTNLNLSFNYLKELGCIEKLTSLVSLDLSNNNLQDLEIDDFSHLSNLKNLSLKGNKIQNLSQGMFSHQNQLEFLDLSYNNFKNIPLSVLLAAVNLEKLFIDGNNMTNFDYTNIKKAFPNIKTIGLGDNNFSCSFLGDVVLFLNQNGIRPIVSSGIKETDTENFNGIKCYVTNETPSQHEELVDSLKVEDLSSLSYRTSIMVQQIGSIERRLLKLNADLVNIQFYNFEHQISSLPNSTNNEKILSLIRQLHNLTSNNQKTNFDFLYQVLNETKQDLEELKRSEGFITRTSSSEDYHRISTEVVLIRNLFIVISAAVFTIICYLLSKKLLKELPRLRQYTSQPTVDGSVEMNSSRDQSPRRV